MKYFFLKTWGNIDIKHILKFIQIRGRIAVTKSFLLLKISARGRTKNLYERATQSRIGIGK